MSYGERRIGRIPVRNLWLLMLYASDLTRVRGAFNALIDRDINDLPDLLANLLADSVERRLRRNLTRGYRRREMVLTRVRGRIDILSTEARLLLSRGEVFCRFDDLTVDTPRNRLIRAALELMVRFVRSHELSHRCRSLMTSLARAGVGGVRPSRADLAADQIGRNDSADLLMVALARLAFDLALPAERFRPDGPRRARSGRGLGASVVRKGSPGVRPCRTGAPRMVRSWQRHLTLAGVLRV